MGGFVTGYICFTIITDISILLFEYWDFYIHTVFITDFCVKLHENPFTGIFFPVFGCRNF